MSEEFSLDHTNLLLKAAYSDQNYKVMQGLSDNGLCVIFFSGNGLYYPNTDDSFRTTIFKKDRYEWSSAASIMRDYVSRIIMVRDVKKSWYVDGINEEINDIDKLIDLLRGLSEGYTVYTYGSSAGGYMAILAGVLLHANRVFQWGAQTDLEIRDDIINQTEFTRTASDCQRKRKYFRLTEYLDDSNSDIFCFYAGKNAKDMQDMRLIRDFSKVHVFLYDSDQHGQGFERDVYVNLLHVSDEALLRLEKEYEGKRVSANELGNKLNDTVDVRIKYIEEKKKESVFLFVRHKLGMIKRKVIKP